MSLQDSFRKARDYVAALPLTNLVAVKHQKTKQGQFVQEEAASCPLKRRETARKRQAICLTVERTGRCLTEKQTPVAVSIPNSDSRCHSGSQDLIKGLV